MFSVAFRGQETCLVGGALIDDFISPIILGSIDVGGYRQGNFLIENIKFVVIASSGLLDVLGYQEIVDCVSLTKDHVSINTIFKHPSLVLFLFRDNKIMFHCLTLYVYSFRVMPKILLKLPL